MGNLSSIYFVQWHGKGRKRVELILYFAKKVRAFHLVSFLLSVLLYTIATSLSTCGNFDS